MILLAQAAKNVKEAFRQPRNLAITLGLPVAFMLIFGFAFGGEELVTYGVAVVNYDDGALSKAYVEGLGNITYGDDTRLVRVLPSAEAEARGNVAKRDLDALVIIPAGFSEDAAPGAPTNPSPVPVGEGEPTPAKGTRVTIVGDPAYPRFAAASQIVKEYTHGFSSGVSGTKPVVEAETEAITSSELNQFDYIAPGLMVFAILSIVPQAASALARETEMKTLDRVRMSRITTAELLGGVALSQLFLAVVSLALMLLTAKLMGFHNQGSFVEAYAIALVAALGVVGIGLVIAAFVKTQQEAANFGVLVSVPMSFLSGAFFPIPAVNLFTWGDTTVKLYDVLPSTHAVRVMRGVLTLGDGIGDYSGAVLAMVGLALLYFVVGVVLFRRSRLVA